MLTNAAGRDGYGYVGDNPETKNDPSGHYVVGPGSDSGTRTPPPPPLPIGAAAGVGPGWGFSGNPYFTSYVNSYTGSSSSSPSPAVTSQSPSWQDYYPKSATSCGSP